MRYVSILPGGVMRVKVLGILSAKFHGMQLYHNHLVLIDRDGKEVKRLTRDVSLDYDPDWWEPGEQ